MQCTCPVCGVEAAYLERYAHKWHKCRGGCADYPGTRMIVVPGGVGIPESRITADWRRAIRRGRALRWAGALFGVALMLAPLFGPPLGLSWANAVAVAAVGACLAGVCSHKARTYYVHRPAGLSAEPLQV